MSVDFAIIGAGVSGLMTALALSEYRSDYRISVIDAGETGSGCSWAGGGILSPLLPWEEHPANLVLCKRGQDQYPELCARLHTETGIDPQCTPGGMVIMDCDNVEAIHDWCKRHKIPVEMISASADDRFPGVRFASPNATVFLPDVAHVRNPRLLRALRAVLEKRGVGIIEHCPVKALEPNGSQVRCVAENRVIEAGKVILCNGAWLNTLLPETSQLPMRPMRGQMLCLEGHDFEVQSVVMNRDCYIIPRQERVMLIGSTVEDSGFDTATTAEARDHLMTMAMKFLPGLTGRESVKQWAGLRPDTTRGYPYIGALPGLDNIFVNAGHFRTGLVSAPAAADLLAAMLTGSEPVLPPAEYAP